MLIIGVDFHSRFQQIAMVDTETGKLVERRLDHTAVRQRSFARSCKSQRAWAWKQPATRNGSRGC